ncbi:hypothetical protein VULLAG_LOCUS7107 [Vulpes lagopus]
MVYLRLLRSSYNEEYSGYEGGNLWQQGRMYFYPRCTVLSVIFNWLQFNLVQGGKKHIAKLSGSKSPRKEKALRTGYNVPDVK